MTIHIVFSKLLMKYEGFRIFWTILSVAKVVRPLWMIFYLIQHFLKGIQHLEYLNIREIKTPGKPLKNPWSFRGVKGLLRVIKSLPWPLPSWSLPLTLGALKNPWTSLVVVVVALCGGDGCLVEEKKPNHTWDHGWNFHLSHRIPLDTSSKPDSHT